MDQLRTLLPGLHEFTFTVDGKSFKILATGRCDAMLAANAKVREDKLVPADDAFAWFEGTKITEYYLGHNVCMD